MLLCFLLSHCVMSLCASLDVPHHPTLFDVPLSAFLLRASHSLRTFHASHYAMNEYYELGFEATLREMWLQKLSNTSRSRPLIQSNSSCLWETETWHTRATGGGVPFFGISFGGALSFFRRAALDHVFPVAVSLNVTPSGVERSWIMVIPSVIRRAFLSSPNAIPPSIEHSGWRIVLWGGMRPRSDWLKILDTLSGNRSSPKDHPIAHLRV